MVIKCLMRTICYIRAIKDLIRYGIWILHCYETIEEPAIIVATESSFRVSDNLIHTPNEIVYPNAELITGRCIYCGKKELSWRNRDKALERI